MTNQRSFWHDQIFAMGSFVLTVALLPSIFSEHKPALWTSLLTCAVLASFTINYASMRFRYSTFITTLTTLCWGTLAIQAL